MVAAKTAPVKKVAEMTVGGFIAYVSKFDNEALILFRDVSFEGSARTKKPTEFSERIIDDGKATQVIVGLC